MEVPVPIVGVKGVQLKTFERVVRDLLAAGVRPQFDCLPKDDTAVHHEAFSLFDGLPPAARVFGSLEGQINNLKRASRKEDQVRSMIRCILSLVPRRYKVTESTGTSFQEDSSDREEPYTIVDCGGGSGHLGIPLALLLPRCHVVVVDLSDRSLSMLRTKASHCGVQPAGACMPLDPETKIYGAHQPVQSCDGIPNLFTFHGSVESFFEGYKSRLDMAVGLHLCGEATDVVLRFAGKKPEVSSVVMAPCCVGKLSGDKKNPYVWQATGSNSPTVRYPQSTKFCEIITKQEDWNALAQAADYSDAAECRSSRNATRRTAKALLEKDRQSYLEETHGFATMLTRMEPWESTPKNDILLAWRSTASSSTSLSRTGDVACQADIQLTVDYLLAPTPQSGSVDSAAYSPQNQGLDSIDWSWEEETEVRKKLEEFLATSFADEVLVFPTKLGGRKRKLVHYVAAQMKLAHWCEGTKSSEKTVAVARRGRRRNSPTVFDAALVAEART